MFSMGNLAKFKGFAPASASLLCMTERLTKYMGLFVVFCSKIAFIICCMERSDSITAVLPQICPYWTNVSGPMNVQPNNFSDEATSFKRKLAMPFISRILFVSPD